MTHTPIISVTNLTKTFDNFTAVSNLSFTVPESSIYGFLGQNGAGKSTTIRMLTTLIQPTSGSLQLFGLELHKHAKEIIQNIGAVIERPDLYKYLTAYENVNFFARLSNTKPTRVQIMDMLQLVGLADRAHSKMKTFSQGMKQRLGIATALIHNPKLVILDEPVNGLDPQGIADIRNLILHLKNELGKTVLVSSHLLSEMEMIATDLLIINKGKKVVEGKLNELLNPNTLAVEIQVTNVATTQNLLQQSTWSSGYVSTTGNTLVYNIPNTDVPTLNNYLVQHQVAVLSLRPKHSLEDYFLQLTTTPLYAAN